VPRYDTGGKDSRTKHSCKKCNRHVDDGWGNRRTAGGEKPEREMSIYERETYDWKKEYYPQR